MNKAISKQTLMEFLFLNSSLPNIKAKYWLAKAKKDFSKEDWEKLLFELKKSLDEETTNYSKNIKILKLACDKEITSVNKVKKGLLKATIAQEAFIDNKIHTLKTIVKGLESKLDSKLEELSQISKNKIVNDIQKSINQSP